MIEIASAFATIVGLMAAFKAEARSAEAGDDVEFTHWLIRKGHKTLADDISANHLLNLSIKNLLSGHHDSVMQQFKILNDALVSFAQRLDGIGEIAATINQRGAISDQAFSILKQMEAAQASRFLESKTMDSTTFILLDGRGGYLDIKDSRFVEDDLDTLCALSLLKQSFNSQGYRLWNITRRASELVRAAPNSGSGE